MGIWDSILPGGSRRFIKRKDSDAGEAGRALEELRGSLYNDFHTSEGAKRQQQRLCGPIVALTFNFVVAVGIIMANKMVMGTVGFNFPVALSLIHYLFALALMAVLKALYLLPVAPPSKSTPFSSLFALGAVMSFSTGLANISLKHNSVGFYQMAKIAVTPTIVVAEFILFKKRVSLRKVITLVVVSFGVAIATVTDLEFNFFGACVALAWIIPSAVNKILWSNLQQSGNWTALAPFIFQLGLEEQQRNYHICFVRFPSSVVWCFGTWGNLGSRSCCARDVSVYLPRDERVSHQQ
ncbi:nucleotide-sugar uncharacterized transporter 2 isoform X5 [Sorghum bicolor]|uniref:nucleotide-sugar uncharacterized transporter 2 isoform X5 n=1 Tax=Sorghum bicolor TaxID=4558 RepID=UPI000B424CDC|nr:nucleotide-sugar uncharacterized transporter 2 isoform X5 [Sorghum bicolor]|eukprot:XP_021305209.1 nucleotide-sugar uncharacterized transporter 2 isoform X5 [Sorghum bicolor]